MKLVDVFRTILNDTTEPDMGLVEVLLRAVVLHTHSLVLADGVVLADVAPQGSPPRTVLAPLTRTHLAELLAASREDARHQDGYWFKELSERTPFELFSDIPAELSAQAAAAKNAVIDHALVRELIEE